MKKYLVIISVLMMAACRDPYEVKTPDLEVWTDNNIYTVGEVVRFHIDGNVDMIDFYSGAVGNDYAYHNRERIFDMVPTVSFRAAKYAGANGGPNENCAALLVSTDFDGNYEFDNVKSTSWIDISERFDIPPIRGSAAYFYETGAVEISDIIEEGKPIYFAWHCTTQPESARTLFQVADFTLSGVDVENPDVASRVASQAQMGFQWVLNEATLDLPTSLPSITNQLIFWNGISNNRSTNTTQGQTHPLVGQLKEGYAISLPITLDDKSMNLGTDSPIPIKNVQTENLIGYSHTFDKAGEYEVTFVGYNVNYNGRKDVVKTIRLTIEE